MQTTFIAKCDFTIKCESGETQFNRGDFVDVRYDKNSDVWISYHEELDGKVVPVEVNFKNQDVFNSLIESLLVQEKELDQEVSLVEMNFDALLIDEGIEMKDLLGLMVESSYSKVRVKENKVIVPVLKIKTELSSKQKINSLLQTEVSERDDSSVSLSAKAITRVVGEKSKFFVQKHLLLSESIDRVSQAALASLTSYFGENAKVRLTKENKIKVNLIRSDESNLVEALELTGFNYCIEGDEDIKFVSFFKPEAQPVVESLYAESDDEEDDEDEDEMDEMKQMEEACKDMYKEMQDKAKEMEESDVDMKKAKEMMESYKKKMEKMKEMMKKEGTEKKALMAMYKEMETSYNSYMKMMDPTK